MKKIKFGFLRSKNSANTKVANLLFCGFCAFFGGAFFSACSQTQANIINYSIAAPNIIETRSDANTIAIEWEASKDENVAGYEIFRSQNNREFNKIATIKNRYTTAYADENLPSNVDFVYFLQSTSINGTNSAQSELITARTSLIEQPSEIKAISSLAKKIKLSWNTHSDASVAGYIIERREQSGSWREIKTLKSRLITEFMDENLADEKSYEYRIIAFNAKGSKSAPSQIAQASTKPRPSAVSGFNASTDQARKIALSWQGHENQDVVKYKILRSNLGDMFFTELITLNADITSCEDILDKDNVSYSYKIIAIDKDGVESLESAVANGKTLGAPAAPIIESADFTNGLVRITWRAADNRAKQFVVYKDTSAFAKGVRFYHILGNEFIDNEVLRGKSYSYSVAAMDENGIESPRTQSLTIKP